MVRRFLLVAFAVPALAGVVLTGCGDGPDEPASTPTPTATSTSTSTTSWPGPAPRFTDHIVAVSPDHGAQVTQASTRTPDPRFPQGVCFEAIFEGLGNVVQGGATDVGLWFQMAFDDELVTDQLTVVADSLTNPTKATYCYAPDDGLPVGRHTAAASVRDPQNLSAPPRELIGWAFEVTE